MRPTSYPEINLILDRLLIEVKSILGDKFVGMYLSGSLAYGDFNYQTSDVDFVVVAKGIPKKLYPRLKILSNELLDASSTWRKRFDGLIMTLEQFKRLDPKDVIIPALNLNGKFTRDNQTTDSIIQRYIVRKNPVILAGPNPKAIIEPVTKRDLRKATLIDLNHWWKPKLKYTSYLLSQGYRAYAVLTMCRILYTLMEGDIVSKPEAAKWAMKKLSKSWRGLIERSLNWKDGNGGNDKDETLNFVKYIFERSQAFK